MPIRHEFESDKVDGFDTSLVQPSDWNAEHLALPFRITVNIAQTVWSNQPAGLANLFGTFQSQITCDLSEATEVRLHAYVYLAGHTTAELRGQYSLDNGGAWSYMDGATGPSISIATTGPLVSSWVTLQEAARDDVLIRVGGIGGNAAVDPGFAQIAFEFR